MAMANAKCVVFMALLVAVVAICYMLWVQDIDNADGEISTVFFAGCKDGYDNYALQLSRVKKENVVVMMPGDFANHPQNKEPGVIRHDLGGQDVYFGDYSGENLTLSNLVAVLTGNKKLLNGGSGRVISPNPNGRVFLFISAHGYDGLVGIGEREVLTKEKLFEIISQNYSSGKYQSMVKFSLPSPRKTSTAMQYGQMNILDLTLLKMVEYWFCLFVRNTLYFWARVTCMVSMLDQFLGFLQHWYPDVQIQSIVMVCF
ncbi:putative legumain protein [Helianthus anomalus]